MKRPFLLFLPFLLFVAGVFVACDEVKEEGKYDNWQQRNEAFIDSIKVETGKNQIAKLEDVDKVALGELFAVPVLTNGTNVNNQYVYCKKLLKNDSGKRPVHTGAGSTVSTYYYGTFVTGDKFNRCFEGYGALDRNIQLPLSESSKWETAFDSPVTFSITGSGVVSGLTWALQHMRAGERWIIYIPWQCGYGASDITSRMPDGSSASILGYSALTYDVILNSIK